MNERQQYLERQNTLIKSFLNVEIQKTLLDWRGTRGIMIGAARSDVVKNYTRFNALIQIAQEMGFGFDLQINDNRILGGIIPAISDEARKYLQHGTRESLIFRIPSKEERRKLHGRL